MLKGKGFGCALAAAGFICVAAPVTAQIKTDVSGYHLTKSIPLGAPDQWDYVVFDPSADRVYLAHGDRLTVVDGSDGKRVGEVTGIPGGTHGTGISPQNGRGYTDDGKAGTAVSFDLKSLVSEKAIKADGDADAIAVDPASHDIYVVSGEPGTLTVIDPKADSVITRIAIGGDLEAAVADGSGKLYVNGAERREVVRVDTQSNKVDARWPIQSCASPHGIAIDPASKRLFVSCRNSVGLILDVTDGRLVASLPIGRGTDSAAFDPKRKLFFSSNGIDGTISVIAEDGPDNFVAAGTIKTQVTARTMAIDPDTGRLYLAAADVDLKAASVNGRPHTLPGSLKLLFIDPAP